MGTNLATIGSTGDVGILMPIFTCLSSFAILEPWGRAHRDAVSLLERSRRLLDRIHPEDREDAIDLHEKIDSAIAARDAAALSEAGEELKELLFFVEDQ